MGKTEAKNPMLDLTNTQAKIIKTFMDNYRDESNEISIGLTANKLEEYGNVSKTFRNHKDYFLENYFLRPTILDPHGMEDWHYFQITQLGVLAYLKWLSTQDSKEVELDRDFFPCLYKYWGELVEMYEQVLSDVLKKTLDRIEIRPEIEGTIRGEEFFGGRLDESIIIHLDNIEVRIFRKYKQPEVHEFPTKRDWGVLKQFENLNQEIDDKITERFTFLLFFNLLNSGTDAGEFLNTLFPNHIKPFDWNKESLTEDDKEKKKSEIKNFYDKMQKNTSDLFTIIKNDEDLHALMKKNISEIISDLSNRKNLLAIYEKLN